MSSWYQAAITPPCEEYKQLAKSRQNQLTKPAGSMGQLELLAVELAAMQGRKTPLMENIAIRIFAADHGLAEQNVSAFPQSVTVEMVKNFLSGGAAICVLARSLGADFGVVNVGTATYVEGDSLMDLSVARGTKNIAREAAMTPSQFDSALLVGKNITDQAATKELHCFVGGEMGIGNTSSAAAVACGLLGLEPEQVVGLGTGVDDDGLQRKVALVQQALELHRDQLTSPSSVATSLGGFEIVALAGAYLQSAMLGVPILVDGFICTVAALLACRMNPELRPWLLFAHQGAEAGHRHVLDALGAAPLLKLDLRLGEASGAAVALPLLRLACDLHNNMATFEEASVSEKSG